MSKHKMEDRIKNNCIFTFYPNGILKSIAMARIRNVIDEESETKEMKRETVYVKMDISDFKFLKNIQESENRKLIYIGDLNQHISQFSKKVSTYIDKDTKDIILRNINIQ